MTALAGMRNLDVWYRRDDGHLLFLQIKEAQPSVLELTSKSKFAYGERVVAGQRLMQAASDIFFGWERAEGMDGQTGDFYIRQLRDWKGSIDPDPLRRPHRHRRILGKSAAFDEAVAAFWELYADQNERDYATLSAPSATDFRAWIVASVRRP